MVRSAEAPCRAPHPEDDSREWRGLRQANIALIHSDPQAKTILSPHGEERALARVSSHVRQKLILRDAAQTRGSSEFVNLFEFHVFAGPKSLI
jgi:hypothetical protein